MTLQSAWSQISRVVYPSSLGAGSLRSTELFDGPRLSERLPSARKACVSGLWQTLVYCCCTVLHLIAALMIWSIYRQYAPSFSGTLLSGCIDHGCLLTTGYDHRAFCRFLQSVLAVSRHYFVIVFGHTVLSRGAEQDQGRVFFSSAFQDSLIRFGNPIKTPLSLFLPFDRPFHSSRTFRAIRFIQLLKSRMMDDGKTQDDVTTSGFCLRFLPHRCRTKAHPSTPPFQTLNVICNVMYDGATQCIDHAVQY